MTYTRRAFSVALAAASMTFVLAVNHAADAEPTAAVQPAQFSAQLVPGQTYQIEIPHVDVVDGFDYGWDAARARGPIQPWPGRTFTAEYLGVRCNEVGCFPAWLLSNGVYGHVPAHWVQR